MEVNMHTPKQGWHRGAPKMRRWTEQRWLVDNVIRANGIDWDQPRSFYFNAPCGMEANSDFAEVREKIKKYDDIEPTFAALARRREAKAVASERDGNLVTARDNYFIASVQWGASQWTIHEHNDKYRAAAAKKIECYSNYVRLSDRRVERVDIPFKGKRLSAWLHLPPGTEGNKVPIVVTVAGMDSFKEMWVALYGDRWLNRGMAVMAIEGPGQYEALESGLPVSVPDWADAGTAVFDWLAARPDVDPERIGISGNSFGSFFATIAAAHEPRFKACAVSATCLEPGCHTIFEEASPTFKSRFMYMSNIVNEAEFDEFCKTLTWEGHVDKLSMPYLCVAGEHEELCPIEHVERLLATIKVPKQFVLYQGARHALGASPSTSLGPSPQALVSDWMAARLAGKPFNTERWYVETSGVVTKSPL
jgi:dienelactone hydrolase